MTDTFGGDEIAKAVTAGDSDTAMSELHADYLKMTPSAFNQVVNDMQNQANSNDDSRHHALVERDDHGNVTSISVSHEWAYIDWHDTKVFDASDYKQTANPFSGILRLNRDL